MEEAAYETGPDDRDFINPAAKRHGDCAVSGVKVLSHLSFDTIGLSFYSGILLHPVPEYIIKERMVSI